MKKTFTRSTRELSHGQSCIGGHNETRSRSRKKSISNTKDCSSNKSRTVNNNSSSYGSGSVVTAHTHKGHTNNCSQSQLNREQQQQQQSHHQNVTTTAESTKKYLTKTLNILSRRFNVNANGANVNGKNSSHLGAPCSSVLMMNENKKGTKKKSSISHHKGEQSSLSSSMKILNLSTNIYKIVKQNIDVGVGVDTGVDLDCNGGKELKRKKSNSSRRSNSDQRCGQKKYRSVKIREEMLQKEQGGKFSRSNSQKTTTGSIRKGIIKESRQQKQPLLQYEDFKLAPASSYSNKQHNMSLNAPQRFDKNSKPNIKNNLQNKQNLYHHPARTGSALTQIQNYSSSVLDMSSIHCQQLQQQPNRSNSQLDDYFREKFGTDIADDEESVQKKLKVIKALKRTQELVVGSSWDERRKQRYEGVSVEERAGKGWKKLGKSQVR